MTSSQLGNLRISCSLQLLNRNKCGLSLISSDGQLIQVCTDSFQRFIDLTYAFNSLIRCTIWIQSLDLYIQIINLKVYLAQLLMQCLSLLSVSIEVELISINSIEGTLDVCLGCINLVCSNLNKICVIKLILISLVRSCPRLCFCLNISI